MLHRYQTTPFARYFQTPKKCNIALLAPRIPTKNSFKPNSFIIITKNKYKIINGTNYSFQLGHFPKRRFTEITDLKGNRVAGTNASNLIHDQTTNHQAISDDEKWSSLPWLTEKFETTSCPSEVKKKINNTKHSVNTKNVVRLSVYIFCKILLRDEK